MPQIIVGCDLSRAFIDVCINAGRTTSRIENTSGYTPGTNLRAWLYTIVRNRFYSNSIKRARERSGDDDCASQQPTVSAQQEWQVRIKELETALEKLSVHYREAIVLVVVLEESYAPVAEVLGKPACGKTCPVIDGIVEEVLQYFADS